MSYLVHHGILGQKWGVRRYQNPDGTLTPEGKERYAYYSKYSTTNDKLGPTSEKYPTVYKNGKHVIKEGTVFDRVATKNEPLDSKRKYVSITDDDKLLYRDWGMSGYFGLDVDTSYEYKAKRDLYVAGGHKVADYVIEKYGDAKVDEAYRLFRKLESLNYLSEYRVKEQGGTKLEQEFVKSVRESYHDAESLVSGFMNKSLFTDKKISSEIFDHFAKEGYDAIVDVEDWIGQLADFPIILLNPKDSVELKSRTPLFGDGYLEDD